MGEEKSSGTVSSGNLAFGTFIVMLGCSAGLTFYTKRTNSMLKQMEKVQKQQVIRKGPVKSGPQTKQEWDKTRPRFEKDDFF